MTQQNTFDSYTEQWDTPCGPSCGNHNKAAAVVALQHSKQQRMVIKEMTFK